METITRTEGSYPVSGNKGTAAKEVSPLEKFNLSINFIGVDPEGRYIFRYIEEPLSIITGDFADFCDWCDVHQRARAGVL